MLKFIVGARQFVKCLSIIALIAVTWMTSNAQTVLYVNDNAAGANNGTSWANAYTDLQSAINAAVSGDQIWVATGEYRPSRNFNGNVPANEREKIFVLKNGVKFYGGFAGGETALAERNIWINPTILSGDLNEDDGSEFVNSEENSYHVVVASGLTQPTTLDGFTITGGNADSYSTFMTYSNGNSLGAGLFVLQGGSNLLVTNCLFTWNKSAEAGGAIFIYSSSATVSNSFVTFNSAMKGGGVGINGVMGGTPILANLVVYGNVATNGGGIGLLAGGANIVNSSISANSGYGIYTSSTFSIRNSIVYGNTGVGAGPHSIYNSSSWAIIANHNNIEGGFSGTGNINQYPRLRNIHDVYGADNIPGNEDDGLRLLLGSKCINTGLNTSIPAGILTDISGDARVQDDVVNMGAYETSISIPQRWYVNATANGSNEGTTWVDAFTSLQSALAIAYEGDVIWVAKGTYRPSHDKDGVPTSATYARTFVLKNGVKLYGGFGGHETEETTRNIVLNPTFLSGDHANNDLPGFGNVIDNSTHVVLADGLTSETILDGFTVIGGSATLSNSYKSFPEGNLSGGGLFIYESGTALKVSNCTFSRNSALYGGGGGVCAYSSSPTFLNCFFSGNRAHQGGAVMGTNSSFLHVNSVIVDNMVSTGDMGGGVFIASGAPTFVNCTLSRNHEYGIYSASGASISIKNSIVYGNTGASLGAGAAYSIGGASAAVGISHSNVEGGWIGTGNISSSPGFVKPTDPDGADNIFRTVDDGLRLREGALSVDAGNNADVPPYATTDILGDNRMEGAAVNLGAYETVVPVLKIFVNESATGANNGTSWTNAFTHLQSALDMAEEGDEIWVAKGTYRPSKSITGTVPTNSREKTFLLKNGVKLFGGFAGNEVDANARTIASNPTILSGDLSMNDQPNFGNRTDNSYHVVVANALTSPTSVDGFIITGGNASLYSSFLGDSWGNVKGAGLYSFQGADKLTIQNCQVVSNLAIEDGGALYAYQGSPLVINSIVSDNKAKRGGGIFVRASSLQIAGSVIVGNNSTSEGGGLYSLSSPAASVVNCTIANNVNYGVLSSGASLVIRNSVISGNTGIGNSSIKSSTTLDVQYSLVQGGYVGTGNVNTPPDFFVANDPDGLDNLWATSDDGLVLRASSPAANAGSNGAVPAYLAKDITGSVRIHDGSVNMGAYEDLVQPRRMYVNHAATGTNDGTSWTNAFRHLQSAIDLSGDGDEIWVAQGTYTPTKDYFGNATPGTSMEKTFVLRDGVKMYGGFNGTESTTSERNLTDNLTVLSGDLDGNDVPDFPSTAENSYHVVVSAYTVNPTVLDGFTIEGGNAFSGNFFLISGGHSRGGGLLTIQTSDQMTVRNCAFAGNKASLEGGAVYEYMSYSNYVNCIFEGNSSQSFGGAVYNELGGTSLIGCLISRNSALIGGGVGFGGGTNDSKIINTTIASNSANRGGGVGGNSLIIKNSIIHGNSATESHPGIFNSLGQPTITSSNIQETYPGNLNSDPLFDNINDPDGPDNTWRTHDDGLALRPDSPSANSGNNADVPAGISTDLRGDDRILNTTVNMGAYEKLKLAQTITNFATTNTRIYGETYSLEATGGASGQPVTYTSSDPSVATISGSTITINKIGTVVITAFQSGDATYASTSATQVITVDPKPITVKANSVNKIYGDPNPVFTYTITSGGPLVGSDAFTGSLNSVATQVGTYNIQAGTLSVGPNYAMTFVTNTFEIKKRVIEVTPDAKAKVYGEPDPVFTYQVTAGELLPGDVFSGSLSRVSGTNVGTYAIQAGSLSAGGNYSLTLVSSQSLQINPRPITVSAAAKTKVYGEPDPELTYTITSGSLIAGDNLTGSLTRDSGSDVGTYSITQNNLSAGSNYAITFSGNTLTILARPISIRPDGKEKIYGDPDPVLTYTITSGSLVAGDSFTGSLHRALGNDAGAYGINQGTLSAGPNYSITMVSGGNFRIHARPVSVSADAKTKIYGDIDPAFTYQITSGSMVAGDSFTGSLTREAGTGVGTYTILQGSLSAGFNYDITFASSNLTIDPRPLTVRAASKLKMYGDPNPPFTFTIVSGSLVAGDSFSGSLTSNGVNVGNWPIAIGSFTAGANYHITYEPGTLSIEPRSITVRADEMSKIYGDPDPVFTYSITSGSLVDGDGFSGSLTRSPGSNVGTYEIFQGNISAGSNYSITFEGNSLTIEARQITISAEAKTKTYGEADPEFTYNITSGSLIGADAFTGQLNREDGEDVGSYEVSLGTLALNSNYTIVFTSAELVIEPRALTITIASNTKEYGDVDPAVSFMVTSGTLQAGLGDVLDGTPAREQGENVGEYSFNEGSITIIPFPANYEINYELGSLQITKAPLHVTATSVTRIFGESNPGFELSYAGFKYDDDETDIDQAPVATTTATVSSDAGTYTIAVSNGADDNYFFETYTDGLLTVGKADQVIVFPSIADMNVNAPAFALNASTSSLLPISYSITGPATLTGDNLDQVQLNGLPGIVTITAMQAGNGNYNDAENVAVSFTVNEKTSQSIAFEPLDEVRYGNANFFLEATASSSLAVTYTSSDPAIAQIDGNEVTILKPGTVIITATQPGNDEYNGAIPVNQTLVVAKGLQTISFEAIPVKSTASLPFELSATSSAGLEIEFVSDNHNVATVEDGMVSIIGEGEAIITARQAGNDYYEPASAQRTLVVQSKQAQTITFAELLPVFVGQGDFQLTAQASSGLVIIYSSSNPAVATVEGDIVSIVGAGVTTITASQPGSSDEYLPASDVSRTLVVSKQNQSISFEEVGDRVIGDEPVELNADASSGLGVTFSSSDNAVAVIEGNTLRFVAAGEVVITAAQAGNEVFNSVSVEQAITVAKRSQVLSFELQETRILGEAPFEISATATSEMAVTFTSSNPEVATIEGNVVTLTGSGETNITAFQAGDNVFLPVEVVKVLTVKLVTDLEPGANENVTVHPNPATDFVLISELASDDIQFMLFDAFGRPVTVDMSSERNMVKRIDLSDLTSGTYILRIRNGRDVFHRTIIKL